MVNYKIKINPRAIRELDSIYKYIANEKLAPENARGQVDRIKKAILNYTLFPSPTRNVMKADMLEKVIGSC